MNKLTAICSILLALAGCAAGTAGPTSNPNPLDQVEGGEPGVPGVVAESGAPRVNEPAAEIPDVELGVAAVDAAGQSLAVHACGLLSRKPGDFTQTRMVDPFQVPCTDSVDGVARLGVDEASEVAFTIAAADHPLYLAHVTTGAKASDLSQSPFRLLSSAQIEAAYGRAQIGAAPYMMAVVVETNVDGGVYELLVNTTDEGPAPIYLDAEGNAVMSASGSVTGGWAVFANVPMGLHAVTFGHASEQIELTSGKGWAGCNGGDTLVWALSTYTSLVSGIEPTGAGSI